MKKIFWVWLPALIIGIYTAFVATCMWNWFATRALQLPSVSFLEMVGLVWLIGILTNRPNNEDSRWKVFYAVIDACIPDHKREMLNETLKEQTDNIWIDAASQVFGQFIGNTITLILGFGLHILIGY